jgi:hypothetical protein
MKNRILLITRNIIPYVKELRSIAGSVEATLLMQQLDYWFAKYPEGFYKFIAPCKNDLYKEGDSWIEELAFSAEEFRNAFDKIGIRHASRTDYLKAVSQNSQFISGSVEKFYCSYQDELKGTTKYLRNHAVVDKTLTLLMYPETLTQTVDGLSPSTIYYIDSETTAETTSEIISERNFPTPLASETRTYTHKEPAEIFLRQTINAEVVEDNNFNEQVKTASSSNLISSSRQNVPGSGGEDVQLSKSGKDAKAAYERTGRLPPIEMYREWIQPEMGATIKAYRYSGLALTSSKKDINPEFALYLAKQFKGKDVDFGYSRIREMESNPSKWQELDALVMKWKATQITGDANVNLAASYEKAQKPKRNWDINFKPLKE